MSRDEGKKGPTVGAAASVAMEAGSETGGDDGGFGSVEVHRRYLEPERVRDLQLVINLTGAGLIDTVDAGR